MKWNIGAIIAVGFVLLVCLGLAPLGEGEAIWTLAAGWFSFLGRTFGEMTLDWEGIATAAVALFGLAVGSHLFLHWFYANTGKLQDPTAPLRHWRARWTATILSVVIVAFVAGVAAVGVTHQTTWLATSPEPLTMDERAGRTESADNLKEMAQASHVFFLEGDKRVLRVRTLDKNGNGLHGWQTALLPYFQDGPVSERIKYDLPWHDPANANTFRQVIPAYQNSIIEERHDQAGFALSHYASNVRVIGGGPPLTLKEINEADGASNTILIGEAAGNYKPWGHHANWRDPALGINITADGFGNPKTAGAQFVFVDGSVHFISDKVSPSILKALSTPKGAELVLPSDWDRP